jgi:hypothetical protein
MADMSIYLENKKNALLKHGRLASDSNKFRAPGQHAVYSPHFLSPNACGDSNSHCNKTVKHNTFAAQQLCQNPAKTTG